MTSQPGYQRTTTHKLLNRSVNRTSQEKYFLKIIVQKMR